jgi:hypothetical protein
MIRDLGFVLESADGEALDASRLDALLAPAESVAAV